MGTSSRTHTAVDPHAPLVPDPPRQQLRRLHTAQQVNMWALLAALAAMLVAGVYLWSL